MTRYTSIPNSSLSASSTVARNRGVATPRRHRLCTGTTRFEKSNARSWYTSTSPAVASPPSPRGVRTSSGEMSSSWSAKGPWALLVIGAAMATGYRTRGEDNTRKGRYLVHAQAAVTTWFRLVEDLSADSLLAAGLRAGAAAFVEAVSNPKA